MDYETSLIDEFVAESREHLQTIEDDLLDLEKQKEAPDSTLVDQVFRAIHSVKGAAGFLGLTNINQLSHVMETILSLVRSGEMVPDSRCVDSLLSGADLLASMVDDVHNSNDTDIKDVLGDLRKLLGEEDEPGEAPEAAQALRLDDSSGILGFPVGEERLKALPREQHFLYGLQYDFRELDAKGMTPVDLIRELKSTGEIVMADVFSGARGLTPEDLDARFTAHILYSSILDPDMVDMAVNLPPDKISHMTREEAMDKLAHDAVEAEAQATAQPLAKAAPPPSRVETIRIPVDLLDTLMTLAGELVLVRNQQLLAMEMAEVVSRNMIQRLDMVTSELQESIMRTRMQPIGNVFGKMPRIVRDLSNKLGKQIRINVSGSEVELDKTILELLADPLTHLTRNCCDHGIETPDTRITAGKPAWGTVNLNAYHEGGQINISLEDDGRGIDVEAVRAKALERGLKTEAELAQMNDKETMGMIMLPGFSTAQKVSDVSGRGVGMDVVKTSLEKLGGTIDLDSKHGQGTTIHLRLPLTLAIIPCLIVKAGGSRYAIPQFNLEELVCLYDEEVRTRIESAGNQEVCRLRDQLLPLVRLTEVLDRGKPFSEDVRAEIVDGNRKKQEDRLAKLVNLRETDPEAMLSQSLNFAVVRVGLSRFGLIVDQVLGTEEIVVKPMHPAVKNLSIYSGATVMGDGRVALILDIEGVARHAGVALESGRQKAAPEEKGLDDADSQTVLLFQSGEKERFAVALPLIRRIEHIKSSQIEQVGQREFVTIDGISTMVLRLEEPLDVSPCREQDEMFLLLPKYIKRPFGILMSRLIDIEETPVALNTESYMEDGLLGTDIVRGSMTLFVDIYRLIELAEPDWFEERRKRTPPPGERKKVLVVEDGSFFRQLVRKYLEADGFEVQTAENGLVGLDKLESGDFDLIVSDLEMPRMDGWEFIQTVKRDQRTKDIPSLALTSLSTDEDRRRALDSGYDVYAVKIDREALLTTISRMLSQ